GSPLPFFARLKNASVASNAARAPAGAGSVTGNGELDTIALRKRSGVVAQRSTSIYRAPVRPSRSLICCTSVVRPLPQPPTRTGIREGDASSAASTRRVRLVRGVTIEGLDLMKRRGRCQTENDSRRKKILLDSRVSVLSNIFAA